MSAFNIVEGVTFAKSPWRNTKFGKGTHYIKTAHPAMGEPSEAQQAQRDDFAKARSTAESRCEDERGMERAVCIANEMRSELK